ncbi:MAG: Gfo/Idh/MocA family oxidoreductase, partial [Bacteroidetes bacterium]|nr:Gfo/Idh/MocA family oxidoreductase [Bacteroidota bacterium]
MRRRKLTALLRLVKKKDKSKSISVQSKEPTETKNKLVIKESLGKKENILGKITKKFSFKDIIKPKLKIIRSRSNDKAQKFARFVGCENFGTYNDVVQSEEIDAVYISLPIELHEEWSIKASKAGKHVLCEKSSTTSYSSAKLMIESSKKNNVRIMEGFMFKFHPQHKKVLEFINSNKIGKPFVFCGSYGFPHVSKDDIRYNPELGGGVLNETGCYPIYSSRIIFQ